MYDTTDRQTDVVNKQMIENSHNGRSCSKFDGRRPAEAAKIQANAGVTTNARRCIDPLQLPLSIRTRSFNKKTNSLLLTYYCLVVGAVADRCRQQYFVFCAKPFSHPTHSIHKHTSILSTTRKGTHTVDVVSPERHGRHRLEFGIVSREGSCELFSAPVA